MEIEFPDGPVLRLCAPSAWGPDSMLQQKSKIQKKKEKKIQCVGTKTQHTQINK